MIRILHLLPHSLSGGMAAEDEIHNLHQHLREILFINDCLQEKLEHHLSISDQGNGRGEPKSACFWHYVSFQGFAVCVSGLHRLQELDIPYFIYS